MRALAITSTARSERRIAVRGPPRERSGSRRRVSAGVFEFCSGLVDLVVGVGRHGGGRHRLALAGEREAPSQRVQGSPCFPRGRPD